MKRFMKRFCSGWFGLSALLLGVMIRVGAGESLAVEPIAIPDAAADYTGTNFNPVVYEVDFLAVVTPPYKAEVLGIWLPIPPSTATQQVLESNLSCYPMGVEPQIGVEPLYGNKFAYFEFKKPEGAQIVRHTFKVKVFETRWGVDPDKIASVDKWPASFEPYLRKVSPIVENAEFQKTLKEIVPTQSGPGKDMQAVFDWMQKNMKYSHDDSSLRADAEFAFTKRGGHCSDYHGLCQTIGRSLGYPTRITYGINLFPKNSPSHCKVESFLPPYGWVSFDISETQNLVAAIEKDESLSPERKAKLAKRAIDRTTAGFRDNTWLLLTRGSNYDLVPKASRPVNVVRTIFAEADGVALDEPDPANKAKKEFTWMTVHRYKHDRPGKVPYPYKDLTTLEVAK